MNKSKKMNRLFVGLFGGIGLVFTIIGLAMGMFEYVKSQSWEKLPVTVTNIESYHDSDGDLSYRAFVDYEYRGKRYSNVPLDFYSSSMHTGETITVYANPKNGNLSPMGFGFIFLGSFGLIGIIFLAVAIGFALNRRKQKLRYEELMLSGITLDAVIDKIYVDSHLQVNGQSPWRIIASFADESSGKIWEFKSDYLWEDPFTRFEIGDLIRVKVNAGNYEKYYVLADEEGVEQ